ncbi:YihY/virulence factor BrkB family protein [Streptomyces tsukubensis]|uniref:Ribonuclease BN n=1 Tax=Streptomyces tsukubensis TaxID=83656 RepID=A0A1V4AFV8_9ACTN|nr:YihY/virulence factor BrkB family protein [Streptomyces tsukubensis]OON82772.1 ribonuclease BN [Streptomyces tsukubensis]QFR92052.1 YihY family inner membrane protein [Streptomyces tsukubensis]
MSDHQSGVRGATPEGKSRPGRHRSAERPEPARKERETPGAPERARESSWGAVLKRTLKEYKRDELPDRAAALTYYSVLALFPALLVLISVLGIAGKSATRSVLDNIKKLAPGSARDVLTDAVTQLQGSAGLGSVLAVVGVLAALWSASGYVAAFIRTSNAVYDMPEGRPVWKVLPVRVGLTLALLILACVSALIVIFTGALARQVGTGLGIGSTAVTVWSIAKWPVLVLLVAVMLALLYWAAPNAKGRGFRWVTLGSLLALVIWMAASAGFAVYVANFGSYNKTYGTLAGVIIFLIWLWITNLAILLGLEFDAETARERAIASGRPYREEPYVEPRDTRKWSEEETRSMGETGPADPREP